VNTDAVELVVEDGGPGVPVASLPHIFDRFYRVPRRQGPREGGGTGVGLAVVRGLAEAMGGYAAAWPSRMGGLAVAIRLPVESAAELEPQTAEPGRQTAEPEPQTAEPRPPAAEPEPQVAAPEPETAEPEPPAAEPRPQTAEPEPPAAEPRPQTAEPEPPTAEPEPLVPPQPRAAAPQPHVAPEPHAAEGRGE
jgi:hypothetical protein